MAARGLVKPMRGTSGTSSVHALHHPLGSGQRSSYYSTRP